MRGSVWRAILLLGLFAPEACAQSRPHPSPLPPNRIAVVEAPADSLTVQVAAQLRERLTKSTADTALRVVSKFDVNAVFSLEHPATLSAGDYQAIAYYTRSTVVTVTASRQHEVVRIRSLLYTARDSVGRAIPDATGRTSSEAVDQLVGQLKRMPRTKLFSAP